MLDNINILNELKEAGSTVLINAERRNIYSVPVDYFNDFSQNLLSRIFVESIPPVNIYTVPAGYFDNLSGIILDKLSIREGLLEFNGLDKMPYSIPDDYFDNLAKNVLQKIKAEASQTVRDELEEISPLLSKIPKTNVYSVPAGYFNELDPIKKEIEKPAAQIISIGTKARKWVSYAAAACIVILFGGGYLYIFNKPTVVGSTHQTAGVDVQRGVSELTDAEIAKYLREDNSTAIYTNQGAEEQKDLDIKSLLENTSDEEIEQYLINNADPGEKEGGI